jgi:hypothetical protein
MNASKPATQSLTIWSGIAAILSGLASLALLMNGNATADVVPGAVTSILAGAGAVYGRLTATKVIGS